MSRLIVAPAAKKGSEFQAIGVTKGGRNSKIHAIGDDDRSPWVLILTQDVPAVYTPPRDPGVGLVCLDEATKQLIKETRD